MEKAILGHLEGLVGKRFIDFAEEEGGKEATVLAVLVVPLPNMVYPSVSLLVVTDEGETDFYDFAESRLVVSADFKSAVEGLIVKFDHDLLLEESDDTEARDSIRSKFYYAVRALLEV